MAELEDAALLDGVEACDAYLEAHERASKLVRQGFLKLAMARRHLPAHALSEISYREEFDATVAVQVPDADDEAWQLETPGTERHKEEEGSLTRRKNAQQQESEQVTTVEDRQEGRRAVGDPILWFSSLPPNDLRQAQKLFASGLQALLEAAESARKVQHAVETAA